MSSFILVQVNDARIRPERADALSGLIQQLFNRRNLPYIPPKDRTWLTVELIQSLRRQSTVYKALSEKTTGPLPFGLGYLRLNGEAVEATSDAVPVEDPNVFVRVLSEFVRPGARLSFTTDGDTETWRIKGKDEVARLSAADDTTQAELSK
jgi:hypothetical protein